MPKKGSRHNITNGVGKLRIYSLYIGVISRTRENHPKMTLSLCYS